MFIQENVFVSQKPDFIFSLFYFMESIHFNKNQTDL